MNGCSVYGLTDYARTNKGVPPLQEREQPDGPSPPPKTAPRTTVTKPVTVGTLREAKGTERVPITQRVKAPEVPARERVKKKTVAFGVTTNVSQTVEREKDPHPVPVPRLSRPRAPSTTRTTTMSSLGRVGIGATRPSSNGVRPPAAAAAPAGGANENLPPAEEERKDVDAVVRLEARVAELEKRERKQKAAHLELQRVFDHVVQIVTTLTQRIAVLEVEKEGGGRVSSVESVAVESREYDEEPRHRRRLYSSDEDGRGREREGRGGTREREERDRSGKRANGGNGILGNEETLRALERQMSSNPLLRRHLLDAIDQMKHPIIMHHPSQDKYEHEYGDRRRTTHSPVGRRGAGQFDEYEDEQRAPAGRCGTAAGSAPNHRWREERHRTTPPGGTGGRRGGGSRKRNETTPSRRRVTERVTMERVLHHFDDTDESDEDPYTRYDANTQYEEEVISQDFASLAHVNGRGGGHGHRNQAQQHGARGGPTITELSDSEEEMERRRRLLRERKEARGGRT